MRLSLFLITLLSLNLAQAVTTGRYVGVQMLVGLVSHSYDGSQDTSPQRLYELMNRPVQDSMMGKGKALAAEKKILNFVCSDRGQNQFSCAINIHQSAYGQISAGKATFQVTGPEAQGLFDQFHSQNGIFSFRDDMGLFMIEATSEKFLMVFSNQGV